MHKDHNTVTGLAQKKACFQILDSQNCKANDPHHWLSRLWWFGFQGFSCQLDAQRTSKVSSSWSATWGRYRNWHSPAWLKVKAWKALCFFKQNTEMDEHDRTPIKYYLLGKNVFLHATVQKNVFPVCNCAVLQSYMLRGFLGNLPKKSREWRIPSACSCPILVS
jgi:hypothetical protein